MQIMKKLIVLSVLLAIVGIVQAQKRVPENSSSPIYYHKGRVGLNQQSPASLLHLYLGGATAQYPTVTSRGDLIQFLESHNNAIEIGNSRELNARRAWILARHSSTIYGKYYSTLHLQPDVGDKTVYKGVAIGYPASQHLSTGTHLAINGKVGIGTLTPHSLLNVQGGTIRGDLGTVGNSLILTGTGSNLQVKHDSGSQVAIYNSGGGVDIRRANGTTSILTAKNNGRVGIGVLDPAHELDVAGTIRATEIKVEAKTADFVFDKDYLLRPLTEVEAFVREHKHLPEIPSAKEMEQEGVNVAQMNKLLLQKVEELTLYAIELEKRDREKENKLEALEKQLSAIKDLLLNKSGKKKE
jgi:hypothetical protein